MFDEEGEVVFLHRIMPGGADKSYGVHVAQLAGLPPSLIARARELLRQHEAGGPQRGRGKRPLPGAPPQGELSLFGGADDGAASLAEELRSLDVDNLTPMQALARLAELRQQALDG